MKNGLSKKRVTDLFIECPGLLSRLGKTAIFLAVILPVLVIVSLSYVGMYRSLTKMVLERRLSTAQLAALAAKQRLDRLTDIGLSFTTHLRFRELISKGQWTEAADLFKDAIPQFPDIDRILLTGPNGTEMADLPHLSGALGKNLAYPDWYQGVSREWKPYVSEAYQTITEPPYNVIAVALPIKADDGGILGILVLQVRLNALLTWSKAIHIGPSGFVYFVDRKGRLVTHPGFSLQGKIQDFSTVPAVQKVLRGQTGTMVAFSSIEKEEHVVAYAPVPDYGWGAIAAQPKNSAFGQRDRTLRFILLVDSAIVCLSGALALLIVSVLSLLQKREKVNRILASIVESSNDAIIGKTLEGVITSWNQGAERIYGYTAEEVLGHSISIVVPEDRQHEVTEFLQRIGRGERIQGHETVRKHKDGHLISVSLTVSPIKDASGKLIGASVIAHDIRHRKQVEEELAHRAKIMRSLLEDLEVPKKKLEAQTKALEEANQRLRDLSRLKDEFVATVSHELRTPLTAIKEGVSLLADEVLGGINKEQREFLEIIDKSVDRLTELVNNVLDLAKIEAGRIHLVRRKVSLKDLIQTAVQAYKPIVGRRQLRTDLGPVEGVFADSDRVFQVLGNLLSNAVKFTKEDGTIRFSLEGQNGCVALSVEDDGIGIAKEDLEKLFQRFSQVGHGGQRPSGTGLGLALCKQLVEMHRGSISATSQLGKGSKFTFTVPVYTSNFALEENFREQLEVAEREEEKNVGVIAVDCETFRGDMRGDTDFIRKHLHSSDAVTPLEPHWIVIMAAAGMKGIDSIQRRLQDIFEKGAALPLGMGVATYPQDGADIHTLLRKATESAARKERVA